jgi:tetratricopeptide (TPR) repeat protein
MALEGRLRDLALSDVFQLLELSRKSGTLCVQSDVAERCVVVRFADGFVTGAETAAQQDRVGRLLVRLGKLSELDRRRALQEQRRTPGAEFCTVAIRMGVVTEEAVTAVIRDHVESTVAELFRWKDGRFRFEEQEPGAAGEAAVRIPTRSLLMEAARRADEWSDIAPGLADGEAVPALSPTAEGGQLDLDPEEWEVLAAIDGERSIRQIARGLGRADTDVARTIDALLASRTAVLVDPASVEEPAGVASLTEMLAEAEALLRDRRIREARPVVARLVEAFPDDARAGTLDGRLLLHDRRWAQAAGRLQDAIKLDPLHADAHFHLGFAAARCGDLPRAESAWRTFLRLPGAAASRAALARAALDAAAAFRSVLEAGAT